MTAAHVAGHGSLAQQDADCARQEPRATATRTHKYTRTCTHTHTLVHTHVRAHIHTHAHTFVHTHTHTCTHTGLNGNKWVLGKRRWQTRIARGYEN